MYSKDNDRKCYPSQCEEMWGPGAGPHLRDGSFYFVKNRYLPLTPCSSRTRPSYVLDTSWSVFYRESEVIFLGSVWALRTCNPCEGNIQITWGLLVTNTWTDRQSYSMVRISQAGNFYNSFQLHVLFQYDTFGNLRCETSFLGFGRDCSSWWHFLSSSSLLLFSSSSISTISSLLNSSWSTLLQVLEKE